MYYSKISIKRQPQMVSYHKEFDLGSDTTLTIADLREYGVTDDNNFAIYQEENKRHTLYISGQRLETKEETKIRIEKDEAYNKRYEEYHKNKNNKAETK
jgi:hypothetical protein